MISVRWIFGFVSLVLILATIIWLLLFPFERMLKFTLDYGIWIHLLFWIVFAIFLMKLLIAICLSFLNTIIKNIPNDKIRIIFKGSIMGITFYGGIILIAILWIGWIQFPWQTLPYEFWNKVIFSLIVIGIVRLGVVFSLID